MKVILYAGREVRPLEMVISIDGYPQLSITLLISTIVHSQQIAVQMRRSSI